MRVKMLQAPTTMPLRFDSAGRLDLSDLHTIKLEILALRSLEELSRRDDRTPGWDLSRFVEQLDAR